MNQKPQKIERLDETFDSLDPEFNTMVQFQLKFNQLADAVNWLLEKDKRQTEIWKEEKKGKCTGAHCKCMNLDKQCPNFHYGDHDCPFDSKPPEKELWEDKFNKKFPPSLFMAEGVTHVDALLIQNLVKVFISSLLATTRTEERERVKGIITDRNQIDASSDFECGYNQACSDILTAIGE